MTASLAGLMRIGLIGVGLGVSSVALAQQAPGGALPLHTPMARVPLQQKLPGADIPADVLAAMDRGNSRSRCLAPDFIKSAIVVDDQTIAVEMAGQRRFAIRFLEPCPGLKFDNSFYYYLSPSRQLCARTDAIVTRSGSRCLINKINRQ